MQYVFFGLPRNATQNENSIRKALLNNFEPELIIKVYSPDKYIVNSRSTESGSLDETDFDVFGGDLIYLTSADLTEIKSFVNYVSTVLSDPWMDGYKSFENLLKQLKCLEVSLRYIDPMRPVMFVRPDTQWDLLFTSTVKKLERLIIGTPDFIITPRWQSWRGVNDRFAITCGSGTIAFTKRYSLLLNDEILIKRFTNGESLLYQSIVSYSKLKHYTISDKFYRTRLNNEVHPERFDIFTARTIKSLVYNYLRDIRWKFL